MRAHWPGLVLTVCGIALIIWLGVTGKLAWFVHPRYTVFSLSMAFLAAAAWVASFWVLGRRGISRRTQPDGARAKRGSRIRIVLTAIAVAAAALALLVLPPTTLTAQSIAQRPVNAGVFASGGSGPSAGNPAGSGAENAVPGAPAPGGEVGADAAGAELREWALLLRQHSDALLVGRAATVLGFVTPDASDPENVFIVTRFVITCCAVDAQPIGVPVFSPGWQQHHAVDEWVSVAGVFAANPSVLSDWTAALVPRDITSVPQPERPYVG